MINMKILAMEKIGLAAAVMLLAAACGKNTVTESGYIPVSEGGQIYYESVGEGLPVILLHGRTLDVSMWDPQVQPLVGAGYRVRRNMPGPSTPFDILETAKKDAEIAAVKAEGVEAWKNRYYSRPSYWICSGGPKNSNNFLRYGTGNTDSKRHHGSHEGT